MKVDDLEIVGHNVEITIGKTRVFVFFGEYTIEFGVKNDEFDFQVYLDAHFDVTKFLEKIENRKFLEILELLSYLSYKAQTQNTSILLEYLDDLDKYIEEHKRTLKIGENNKKIAEIVDTKFNLLEEDKNWGIKIAYYFDKQNNLLIFFWNTDFVIVNVENMEIFQTTKKSILNYFEKNKVNFRKKETNWNISSLLKDRLQKMKLPKEVKEKLKNYLVITKL